MILGVDIGNYYTKSSKGIKFLSKVSEVKGIEDSTSITINKNTMYLGEGEFDTEYRKAYKENLIYLLVGAIQKSTNDKHNKVVVGLPLSQYNEDKGYLSNRILQCNLIDDVEIAPEGIAVIPKDYQGIVIDIGGRTTDIALVVIEGGERKIRRYYSIPKGVLNLESELANYINSKYGLDLVPEDSERILKNGLYVYGKRVELSLDIYKEFVESIVRRVQVDYSIKTNNVALIGGGADTLYIPFKNRIPQAYLVKNPFYANALAYERIGREVFR